MVKGVLNGRNFVLTKLKLLIVTLKDYLSIICTLSAIVLGIIAMFLPPTGIIDSSVLWFTAQLLIFVAALLGINLKLPVK